MLLVDISGEEQPLSALSELSHVVEPDVCVLVVGEDKQLVRTLEVPTPYVTNMAFGAAGTGTVFITGVFDEWKAPYPGTLYRWRP